MRGKSHRYLGRYLIGRYMDTTPRYYQRAFLFGCFQPDWNPTTYLKGSFRFRWLRGHNYPNAHTYMRRISRRLEKKKALTFWDYYTLGKLIHYTADSFTHAHNDSFPASLNAHRKYEIALQEYFLLYIHTNPKIEPKVSSSIIETIGRYHQKYESRETNFLCDTVYTITTCCCILTLLLTEQNP